MREFIHGWRRKVGVATLAMACVFAAGWVRSFVVSDQFCRCTHGISHIHVYSVNGQIWGSRLLEEDGQLNCQWHYSGKSGNVIICNPDDFTWRWKIGEFEFGEYPNIGIGRTTYGIVPYWSIVIPLTLVSAWLLLVNPKQKLSPSHHKAERGD